MRSRRLAAELSKFLTVGAVATAVAFLLFNALVHGLWPDVDPPMNDRPQLAYVVANVVGMLVSFRGTRDWAFGARGVRHPDGGRTAFIVINLVTMVIPMAFLWISRNVFHLDDPLSDNIAANVLGLGVGTAVRFLLLRQYVFPRLATVAATAADEPASDPAESRGSAAN
ncbi:GtrA family protein [Nocardioides jishulii]|uniref:GtrA family protein n=1 Tax=Nocardioides jishulii TaxID=2575440 RepID=A0A4U2YIP1_9ACTN|nr:GtrA family protein [Nocardioides jishulii]QCX28255.1 GtrA family protein [Nocardioides jishulii]TKI60919.1 GtrA family protein [Nocardioides jishulii]